MPQFAKYCLYLRSFYDSTLLLDGGGCSAIGREIVNLNLRIELCLNSSLPPRNRTMPKFIITTKQMKNANGIRIEPGMSVEVVTQSMSNPVLVNGGQPVVDAFMRIYGIDIRRAGALNMSYLDVERIN